MITVIIPTYNRPDCLQKALASLNLQTDQRFNVVVVDDCSTEDIEGVVNPFRQVGMTIHYIRPSKNGGAGVARNVGLEFVTKSLNENSHIVFLDSDDIFMPNAIATYNSVVSKRKDYEVIYTYFLQEEFDESGNTYYEEVSLKNITWVHGKIYSLEFLNKNDIRFPEMRYGEDAAFNAVVFATAQNIYNAHVPTHIRTREKRSLTHKADGTLKSLIGYLEGVEWYAENLKNRNLLEKTDDGLLAGTACKTYYYYDYLTHVHPELNVRDFVVRFYKNIGLNERMSDKKFVKSIVQHFCTSYTPIIEDNIYTPFKSFDETMKELGFDIGDYRSLFKPTTI